MVGCSKFSSGTWDTGFRVLGRRGLGFWVVLEEQRHSSTARHLPMDSGLSTLFQTFVILGPFGRSLGV